MKRFWALPCPLTSVLLITPSTHGTPPENQQENELALVLPTESEFLDINKICIPGLYLFSAGNRTEGLSAC
jgi:hypothetical protein